MGHKPWSTVRPLAYIAIILLPVDLEDLIIREILNLNDLFMHKQKKK